MAVDRLRHSCLAVPGSNPRMIRKAAASDASEVFLDLEDAVAPNAKVAARATVVEALTSLDFGTKVRSVRINDVTSALAYRDILDVVVGAGEHLDTLMVPKVDDASQVHFVDHLLSQLEADLGLTRPIGLELLIESPAGAVGLREIVAASARTEVLIFGVGDYSISLGVARPELGQSDDRYPGHQWHWAMSEISNHARAAGIKAIDGPYVDFGDEAGYRESALRGRLLGFSGKWCIHPAQIPAANAVYSTTVEEARRATALLEAYGAAQREGRGAVVFEGLMIDDATRKLAEALVREHADAGQDSNGAEAPSGEKSRPMTGVSE